MRDGEGINFIEVLEATKEKRKIILIIDKAILQAIPKNK
jgi:hypothetical protein